MLVGRHDIKTWSSTQAGVALSSGEAEFHGLVRGAGVGLGYQSLLRDLGQDLPLRLWTDSSAAIGISTRQGLGKLRHLDTQALWIQQAVRTGRVDLRKVHGLVNPADLFTKHSLTRERLMDLTKLFDCNFTDGRAATAPRLRTTPSSKTTMADAADPRYNVLAVMRGDCEDEEEPGELLFPHLAFSEDVLNKMYPSLTASEQLAGDICVEQHDDLLEEGMKRVDELVQACQEQGRKRRIETTGQARIPSCR